MLRILLRTPPHVGRTDTQPKFELCLRSGMQMVTTEYRSFQPAAVYAAVYAACTKRCLSIVVFNALTFWAHFTSFFVFTFVLPLFFLNFSAKLLLVFMSNARLYSQVERRGNTQGDGGQLCHVERDKQVSYSLFELKWDCFSDQ